MTFLSVYYGEPEHQYVFFNIINACKYPELITPIENEENIQLTDWVLFPKEYIGIETNYQENEIVKRRPSLLTERFGDQAVLWKDEVNKQLGVSVGEFCNIFPLSNIKKSGHRPNASCQRQWCRYPASVLQKTKIPNANFRCQRI
ncbi:hypothetical protein QIU18_11820 [Capnocytophaga canimorsus]|nr:hypothetical protein [Capnocytophaga canimorsus]WGU70175.1 hypothetical protein QIU18_11820 [Capnocytophaga canimorsus]